MPKLLAKPKTKRIGILFHIESNMGGAATQADDMVRVAAKELGHDACLIRFTTKSKSPHKFDLSNGKLPEHQLFTEKSGIKFKGQRILLASNTLKKVINWLDTFDVLIHVGGCPHITRSFTRENFYDLYYPIYNEVKARQTMFLTDPFWPKLYPYCKDIISRMARVYAFAEAYRTAILKTKLRNDIEVCNFGSIGAANLAKRQTRENRCLWNDRKHKLLWPHQWRSWKNPLTFIQMVPHLTMSVDAYADGIEYHQIRSGFKGTKPQVKRDWERALREDRTRGNTIYGGPMIYHGTRPQRDLLEEFNKCAWTIDLTGMSGRTGKPIPKFVGNYQCVNIESMMLGCVNFKYKNTIAPYSRIPEECVISIPLVTNPRTLAELVNEEATEANYKRVAPKAREWALANFDPVTVFKKSFLY